MHSTQKLRARWNPDNASVRQTKHRHNQLGLQLLELLIALAIVAVLAFIIIPAYSEYLDKAHNAAAIADIHTIDHAIERYYDVNNSYPDFLANVKMGNQKDPWHHAYRYLKIAGAHLKGKGALRKDKNQIQINSDYDLYSMGKDGASVPPLTAKMSRDDIIRAYNGKYIGLASEF